MKLFIANIILFTPNKLRNVNEFLIDTNNNILFVYLTLFQLKIYLTLDVT